MTQREHAVVIGGSMAGLFAARVLSDHFKHVTIIDRDELPDAIEFRGGVPQSRHLHQLLIRGQQIMEKLFPTLPDDLAEIGSPRYQWGYNSIGVTDQGFVPQMQTGLYSNALSRQALEYLIRRRIKQIPNIEICGGFVVTSLLTNADKTVVTGVRAEKRPGKDTAEFHADLIVDATGRRSDAPAWLETLGYEKPTLTHVDAHIGYATCWFDRPEALPKGITAVLVKTNPANGRSGVILEVEGNRIAVILTSKNADYASNDIEGYLDFAKSLQSPLIYNTIKDLTPLTPVYGYRNTDNVWHHYESLSRRPENFVITGDAACAFNPIYGQGMSVAAMDAELMANLLAEFSGDKLDGFAAIFQKRLADMLQSPFALATADDLQQPSVEISMPTSGNENPIQKWVLKQIGLYFRYLIDVCDSDAVVFAGFVRVMNLLEPPTSLLKPVYLFRVARHFLTKPNPYRPVGHFGLTVAPSKEVAQPETA